MSCDFGPIPMPTSPMQTYWEEYYHHSRNSTANQSRSAPITKPEKNNIGPQLMEALAKLAEEQQQSEEGDKVELEQIPQLPSRKRVAHARAPSFGQRLWSTLAGEPVQVKKMKQS